jgi:hypothetical protein
MGAWVHAGVRACERAGVRADMCVDGGHGASHSACDSSHVVVSSHNSSVRQHRPRPSARPLTASPPPSLRCAVRLRTGARSTPRRYLFSHDFLYFVSLLAELLRTFGIVLLVRVPRPKLTLNPKPETRDPNKQTLPNKP